MKRASVASTARDRVFHVACLVAMALPLASLSLLFVSAALDAAPVFGGKNQAFVQSVGDLVIASGALVAKAAALSAPIGIGAALWLEEIAGPDRLTSLVDWSARTLASVPPFLLGLFAWLSFGEILRLGDDLPVIAPAVLALAVLPTVIASSRRALRAVPATLREASFALGANRSRALRHVVLPMALPRIATGVVRSLAYAVGEVGLLLMLGVGFKGSNLALASFAAGSEPSRGRGAAMVVTLLVVVLALHGAASYMRLRFAGRRA